MFKQATAAQFKALILPALQKGTYSVVDELQMSDQYQQLMNIFTSDTRFAEILIPQTAFKQYVLRYFLADPQKYAIDDDDARVLQKMLKSYQELTQQSQHDSVMQTAQYFQKQIDQYQLTTETSFSKFVYNLSKVMVADNNWVPILAFIDLETKQVNVFVNLTARNVNGTHPYDDPYREPFITSYGYSYQPSHGFQSSLSVPEMIGSTFEQLIKHQQTITGSWIIDDLMIIDRLCDRAAAPYKSSKEEWAKLDRDIIRDYEIGTQRFDEHDYFAYYPAVYDAASSLKLMPLSLIKINRQARDVAVAQLSSADSLVVSNLLHQMCLNQPLDHEFGSQFKYAHSVKSPQQLMDNQFALVPLANPRFTRQLAAADFIQKYNSLSLPDRYFDSTLQSKKDIADTINKIQSGKLEISSQTLSSLPQAKLQQAIDHANDDRCSFDVILPNYSIPASVQQVAENDHDVAVLAASYMSLCSATNPRYLGIHEPVTLIKGYILPEKLDELTAQLLTANYYVSVLSTQSANGHLRVYLQVSHENIPLVAVPTDADESLNYQLPKELKRLTISDPTRNQHAHSLDLELNMRVVVSDAVLHTNEDPASVDNTHDIRDYSELDDNAQWLSWLAYAYYRGVKIQGQRMQTTYLRTRVRAAQPDYYVFSYHTALHLPPATANALNQLIIASEMGQHQLEEIK